MSLNKFSFSRDDSDSQILMFISFIIFIVHRPIPCPLWRSWLPNRYVNFFCIVNLFTKVVQVLGINSKNSFVINYIKEAVIGLPLLTWSILVQLVSFLPCSYSYLGFKMSFFFSKMHWYSISFFYNLDTAWT